MNKKNLIKRAMIKAALRRQDKEMIEGRLSDKTRAQLAFGTADRPLERLAFGFRIGNKKIIKHLRKKHGKDITIVTRLSKFPHFSYLKVLPEKIRNAVDALGYIEPLYMTGIDSERFLRSPKSSRLPITILADKRFFDSPVNITPLKVPKGLTKTQKDLLHNLFMRHELFEAYYLSRPEHRYSANVRDILEAKNIKQGINNFLEALNERLGNRVFSHANPDVLIREAREVSRLSPDLLSFAQQMRILDGTDKVWFKATGMHYPFIPKGKEKALRKALLKYSPKYGPARQELEFLKEMTRRIPSALTPEEFSKEPAKYVWKGTKAIAKEKFKRGINSLLSKLKV